MSFDMSYPAHVSFLALQYAVQYIAKHDFDNNPRKALAYFMGNAAGQVENDLGQAERVIREHIAIGLGRELNCGECKHVRITDYAFEVSGGPRQRTKAKRLPPPACSCRYIHQATDWASGNAPTFPDAHSCNLFEWEMKICRRCRHVVWGMEQDSGNITSYHCAKSKKLVEGDMWCDCDSFSYVEQSVNYFERNCDAWSPVADMLGYLRVDESGMSLDNNIMHEMRNTNSSEIIEVLDTHTTAEGHIRARMHTSARKAYKGIESADGRLMWAMHHGLLVHVNRSLEEWEEIYEFEFRFTNDSARGAGFIFGGGRI